MKDRLKQIIDYYDIKVRPFEIKISVSEGTISKFLAGKIGIKAETLQKINAIFPEINMDWLVTGRGDMLYSRPDQTQPNPLDYQIQILQQAISNKDQRLSDKAETILVLRDTIKSLTAEIQQLRDYVNITSQKYIAMVEQTLNTAVDTRSVAREIQTQIGFYHDAHIPKASSDHEPH